MGLFDAVSGFIKKKIRQIAINHAVKVFDNQFNDIKADILHEVKNHPISKELDELTSPSRFIKGDVSPTLYGFLGFNAGSSPVSDLISFLGKNIIIEEKKKFKFFGKKITTNIKLPTKDDMNNYGALHLPWIEVAWPVVVEDGTITYGGIRSGTAFFLDGSFNQSRSNLGIQIKGKVREEILGLPYLSSIFSKYRSQFK